jgi:small conductance mechanosensitive channel
MTNQLATLQHAKEKIVEMGLAFGPKLVVAVLILVAGYFVGRWVGGIVAGWLSKLEMEPPVRLLIVRVIRLLVLCGFLLLALDNLQIKIVPVIAGLGVAGAGVALAMQGVLGNLFAGLTIIFTKPFRVGEYVSMVGVEGRVEAIELFNTRLSHPDLSRIVVPNRQIVGEILHNYGKIRQLDVTVGVAYHTDLNSAVTVIHEVLSANPRILKDPKPVVGVSLLGGSAISISVKPWTSVPDFGPAGAEVNKAIVEAFRQRNISIPFPQHEVRLLNPPKT